MGKLNNTIAVEKGYLEILRDNGDKILDSAKEVTEAIEGLDKQVDSVIKGLPQGVKRTGTQAAIAAARKEAKSDIYRNAKKSMNKKISKIMEEVPQYDKKCGDVAGKLVIVTKSLEKRITSLEELVAGGSVNSDGDTFYKALQQLKEDWKEDEEALKEILKEIKNALKGVENEACRYSKDPVNLSTGNFVYDREDLRIGGAVPLSFHRYYNSLDERSGVLGKKWKHNYEICLVFEKEHITVWKEDGREDCFKKEEDRYVSVTGSKYFIKEISQGYQYEEKYGMMYIFNKLGYLLSVSDANGNQIVFTYNKDNRLTSVKSLSGQLYYHYNENGQLTEVLDHTGRRVQIRYDGDNLCQVITPMKVPYLYTYGTDGNLRSIVNPQDVTTVKNRFDKEGRTRKQNFPDGGNMKFSYDDEHRLVTLTERNGSRTVYEHDERYRNVRTTYADGEEIYAYNRYNQRTSYTDKNGNRTVYVYDNMGNLVKVVDALGNATHITYGIYNKPVCIKTPEGGEVKYSYDERGNLIKQADACGNETRLQYNERGRLEKIVQTDYSEITLLYDDIDNLTAVVYPDGTRQIYIYDKLNRVIASKDEKDNETRYVYDDADRIVQVINPEGNIKKYTYNVSGMVTAIEDFDGRKITRGYNSLNKLAWETDKEGNTIRYEYDLMWNVSRRILPNGGVVTYEYNELNQLESVTNLLGGKLFYNYDKNGNVIRIENQNGEAVTYAYDQLNRRISVTDTLGNEDRIYYDAMGRVIRKVDALGRCFDTVYDLNGNKTAETNAVNGGMTYTYNCMGRVLTMEDGIGRVRKYKYDIRGRVKEMEDFDGRKENYFYDKKGNIICKRDSAGAEYRYTYDSMNRITEVRNKQSILQSFSYDAVGNRLSVTDANGNKTEFRYSPNGNMNQVTDSAGSVTCYEYDAMGQLEKIIYPSEGRERTTVYERNLAGQITKVKDAMGNTEVYEYDCYGRMTGKTDKNGQHTSFGHNAMGDIIHIQYADDKEVYLSYDPLRQLKELQDWTGTTQIVKDETGRTRKIIDASGNTVTYEWGILGERTGVIYPDGQKIIYEYDQYLNLKEVTAGEDTTAYTYDENGRLSGKIYANGMNSRYTYTRDGRLESLLHEDKEGVLDRFYYTYDTVGNCIAEERERRNLPEESGSYRYIYDELGRLTAVEKDGEILGSYEYDAYGNRTGERKNREEIRYSYNEVNQLVKREKGLEIQDYLYDANGNLLQTVQNGGVIARYQYDSIDNMVFAETKQGRAEYQYNGFGKKTGMKVEMAGYEGDGHTGRAGYILDYTKDYNNLLQRNTGGRTETYFWDNSLLSASHTKEDDLLHQETPTTNMTYLLDPLGSPLRFCNAEGGIEESYGYDAFGEDLYTQKDNTAVQFIDRIQPFGFTGYERDDISGLYYAQARRYDAGTGRFISRDMIKGQVSHMQSQNEYAYCLGNPLLYVDRDGKIPTNKERKGTKTIKIAVNANVGIGTGGDIDISWDKKGNVVLQYSYVCPGIDDTSSAGLWDAGIAVQYQWTDAESVYDLEGNASYVGASGGPGWYLGYDTVSFDDMSDMNGSVNGGQMQLGFGAGMDIHMTESYTMTLTTFKKGDNDEQKS